MSWLDFERQDEPEEIDDPAHSYSDIVQSMADLALSNRLFGGTQTVLHHVARLLADKPVGSEVRILDIATGSADIPRALSEWGRRRGLNLTIIGIDNHFPMLRMAQEQSSEVYLAQADALLLPFAPRSFDLAICALAFHHLGFEASAHVLKAMDMVTTRGLIVSDLRRDLPTLWGIQAAFAVMKAHPFTRHDGPASVRRAWTTPEYRKMIGLSGVQGIQLYTPWYFRVALVQNKRENHADSG